MEIKGAQISMREFFIEFLGVYDISHDADSA